MFLRVLAEYLPIAICEESLWPRLFYCFRLGLMGMNICLGLSSRIVKWAGNV